MIEKPTRSEEYAQRETAGGDPVSTLARGLDLVANVTAEVLWVVLAAVGAVHLAGAYGNDTVRHTADQVGHAAHPFAWLPPALGVIGAAAWIGAALAERRRPKTPSTPTEATP